MEIPERRSCSWKNKKSVVSKNERGEKNRTKGYGGVRNRGGISTESSIMKEGHRNTELGM